MNITERLREHANSKPSKVAITFPKRKLFSKKYHYQQLTYRELEERSNSYAYGLNALGIVKGTKILLFVRPSLKFCALAFALFKVGAVPILIDPAMGRKNLTQAIEAASPEALIAVPQVHLARIIKPSFCKSIRTSLSTVPLPFLGVAGIDSLECPSQKKYPIVQCAESDLAAIVFTSGGTGTPKGVEYTHSILLHQLDAIQDVFGLQESDIDMPAFPLFTLFSLALGMSSVIPDMDPTKPSQAKGEKLAKIMHDQKVTFASGSPAIWRNVAEHCTKKRITLPHLKHLMMFGAPVPLSLHTQFDGIMPHGTTHTPYGATEALPITNIDGRALLDRYRNSAGKGICVGKAILGVDIKIIDIVDTALTRWDAVTELDKNIIGEVIVSGPVVTSRYHNMSHQTTDAKIYDPEGTLWHRMGDVAYLDPDNMLWFCGRKAHRVTSPSGTLYSVKVESIFNIHPDIEKTALIGLGPFGQQRPAIVVQRKDRRTRLSARERGRLISELMELAQLYPDAASIQDFFFKKEFPVDVRHNIKIDRLQLSREFSSTKDTHRCKATHS